MKRVSGAFVILALLAGCTAAPPSGDPEPLPPTDESGSSAIASAVELLETRVDLVRDGDYAGACELYSPGFLALFAELAEADPADCVAVHEAAIANADDYLATAAEQGRAGLTPFFYVPSAVEIDASKILSDDPTEAIVQADAVVSLDDRVFEDGAGVTPGWLAGLVYIAEGDDGRWRFIAPGEE